MKLLWFLRNIWEEEVCPSLLRGENCPFITFLVRSLSVYCWLIIIWLPTEGLTKKCRKTCGTLTLTNSSQRCCHFFQLCFFCSFWEIILIYHFITFKWYFLVKGGSTYYTSPCIVIWIIVKILTKFSFFIYKALQTFDAEKTHTVTQSEFKRALDSFCVPLTEDQFEQLIKKVQIPCPSDRCIQNVGTLSQAVLPCSQE